MLDTIQEIQRQFQNSPLALAKNLLFPKFIVFIVLLDCAHIYTSAFIKYFIKIVKG